MKTVFFPTLVLLCSLSLAAQDLEEDIFAEGAFDAAVAQGEESENLNKLVWLGGVSLASTTTLTLPAAFSSYGSLSQFAGKGYLKATNPSVGSLFVSYSYLHSLWAASNDGVLASGYTRADLDPAAPKYTLSELHLSFDVSKVVFIRVGNQLIDWGASAVWSPADFINRKAPDLNSSLDARAGKSGVRIHVPFATGNFFAFADASRSITKAGVAQDLLEVGTVGLKADATLLGWNWGLIGNFGKSADPRLGLTTSGSLLGIDLWAEAGSILPFGGREFSWSASLGGERSFGLDSEWTLRSEGFWNPGGKDDEVLAGATAFTPFYWGKVYLYSELIKKKLLVPDVTGSLSATANLSDKSWSSTASLRTAFPRLIPFSLYTQYNGGESNREFTLATGGPAWTFGLRSLVEF